MDNVLSRRRLCDLHGSAMPEFKAAAACVYEKNCSSQIEAPSWMPFVSHASVKVYRKSLSRSDRMSRKCTSSFAAGAIVPTCSSSSDTAVIFRSFTGEVGKCGSPESRGGGWLPIVAPSALRLSNGSTFKRSSETSLNRSRSLRTTCPDWPTYSKSNNVFCLPLDIHESGRNEFGCLSENCRTCDQRFCPTGSDYVLSL